MAEIIRTDGSGEHRILFTKGDTSISVHTRYPLSHEDHEALQKAVRGVAYCFDRAGGYESQITVAKAYCDEEVMAAVSRWLAKWLSKKHPQTVMDKICSACCPYRS